MVSPSSFRHNDALSDFYNARRKATFEAVLARIRGKSPTLLPYDEIRSKLGGIEQAHRELQEIPLDAIIGTVSRYNDFTRSLLPMNPSDGNRWANVRVAAETLEGLPPIEVYQVGDAYFILDGHHRASVARELGATHIQAYVRKVQTRVPLTPEDQIEDIILKAEYTEFLKQTRLDELRPGANLVVTAPGVYEKLLEHISVHRYFQGIDENRPVPYEEAVVHWYDTVYQPVVKIIRSLNILRYFPGRTETDLYLWITEHRAYLESELGWKINLITAAQDLSDRFSPKMKRLIRRIVRHLVDLLTPDELEPSIPPGEWRKQRVTDPKNPSLFNTILIALPGDEASWRAMEMALFVASLEKSFLGGLHVVSVRQSPPHDQIHKLKEKFQQLCEEKNIEGNLTIETGEVSRVILDRAHWADLLVLRLLFPPPLKVFSRLRSGIRQLIRLSPVPLLVFPAGGIPEFSEIVLAYGGGPRADEALFLATYFSSKHQIPLQVITVDRGRPGDNTLEAKARGYLESHNIPSARFVHQRGNPARVILDFTRYKSNALIVMGGYEGNLIRELLFGSTVDRVLWSTKHPVLICH